MSVVEDVRKVLQDFLAPELREQKAELESVNRRLDGIEDTLKQIRLEAKERRQEAREDSAQLQRLAEQSRVELRSDIGRLRAESQTANKELETELKLGFREVRSDMRLSERVEKIEKTMSAEQQH